MPRLSLCIIKRRKRPMIGGLRVNKPHLQPRCSGITEFEGLSFVTAVFPCTALTHARPSVRSPKIKDFAYGTYTADQSVNVLPGSVPAPRNGRSIPRLWFADLFFHWGVIPRARSCSAISTAAATYILQDGTYCRSKWHSVFQMTRRYTWQRHTTRVVRTFIRLPSRARQSRHGCRGSDAIL